VLDNKAEIQVKYLEMWRFFFSKNLNILGKNVVYTKLDFIWLNFSQLDGNHLTNFFAIKQLHVNTKREFAVRNMQHILGLRVES